MYVQPAKLPLEKVVPQEVLPDITIVIPTLGRPILEQALCWIACGTAWPARLTVVDQGRNEKVASWLAALNARGLHTHYIASEQKGRAAGVNRGLEATGTRFVAITDDDCFVEEEWLARLRDHLRKDPQAIVTGRVEAGGDDVTFVVTSRVAATQYRPRLSFDRMSGGNMGISLDVLKRVGLFDEDPRLRTAEDAEWAYRALRAGIPIHYAPDVGVRHRQWGDHVQQRTRYYSYARCHGSFYGKYLRKGDWFIAIRAGIHYLRATRHWFNGVTKRDPQLALVGRAYMTGLLPGIISGLRQGVVL